jgi:hypothetical protein
MSEQPYPNDETDQQARARWLDHFRLVVGSDDGDEFIIATFDGSKNFYIQAIRGHCEVVSRSYAPDLTDAQEALLRELGWQPPAGVPAQRRSWFKRGANPVAGNWTLDVDGDLPVDDCIDVCRRTAEMVFQISQPVALEIGSS